MLINISMGDAGGYKADDMWGPTATRTGVEAQRPDGQHRPAGRQQHPPLDLLRQRHAVGSSSGARQPAREVPRGLHDPHQQDVPGQLHRRGRQERRVQLPGQRHAQLVVGLLYTVLVAWFTEHAAQHPLATPPLRPWYRHKKGFAFADILRTAQRVVATLDVLAPDRSLANLRRAASRAKASTRPRRSPSIPPLPIRAKHESDRAASALVGAIGSDAVARIDTRVRVGWRATDCFD